MGIMSMKMHNERYSTLCRDRGEISACCTELRKNYIHTLRFEETPQCFGDTPLSGPHAFEASGVQCLWQKSSQSPQPCRLFVLFSDIYSIDSEIRKLARRADLFTRQSLHMDSDKIFYDLVVIKTEEAEQVQFQWKSNKSSAKSLLSERQTREN